jgi:hypothetical protein
MHLTTAVWFGLVLLIVLGAAVLVFRRTSARDLGSVSDQWVAQHRASDTDSTS